MYEVCPRCGGRMFHYASSFVWLCTQCGYEEPDYDGLGVFVEE